LITKVQEIFLSLTDFFRSYLIKAINYSFCVYRPNKTLGMFVRRIEKLVDHEPLGERFTSFFECSPNIPRGLLRP